MKAGEDSPAPRLQEDPLTLVEMNLEAWEWDDEYAQERVKLPVYQNRDLIKVFLVFATLKLD
jgi:hypothetical protein